MPDNSVIATPYTGYRVPLDLRSNICVMRGVYCVGRVMAEAEAITEKENTSDCQKAYRLLKSEARLSKEN